MGRCPRCGYVLRFDGYKYTCDFCGYPRSQPKWTEAIRGLENNLRRRVQTLIHSLRGQPPQQVFVYYPLTILRTQFHCNACGILLATGTPICPNCGTKQSVPQPLLERPTQIPDTDRKVYNYIVTHEGTISLTQAARDLSLKLETIQSAIERLKNSGLLNQA